MNILILGLAGSGKTTLANKLSLKLGYEVISLDTYRYGPNWQKKDFDEFRNGVMAAINKDTGCPKIIESVYNDSDSTKARIRIIQELLPVIKHIYIIKPESLEIIAAQLIDRCIERALLKEKGLPTIIEKPLDRARLLISNITMYEQNVNMLMEDFKTDMRVVLLSRDELTNYLQV